MRLRIFTTFLISLFHWVTPQSFLFPHGYFDMNKLQPRDGLYLNMMANSNLEYGGTTEEELNQIVLDKMKIPNPRMTTQKPHVFEWATSTTKPKTDGEDEGIAAFEAQNKEKQTSSSSSHEGLIGDFFDDGKHSEQTKIGKQKGEETDDFPKPPPPPFRRVYLRTNFAERRLHDDVMDSEEMDDGMNPFDEIATRAPPPGMRRRRKKKRRNGHETSSPEMRFLTRDTIVKVDDDRITVAPKRDRHSERKREEGEQGFVEQLNMPKASGLRLPSEMNSRKEDIMDSYHSHRSTTLMPRTGSPDVVDSYKRHRSTTTSPLDSMEENSETEEGFFKDLDSLEFDQEIDESIKGMKQENMHEDVKRTASSAGVNPARSSGMPLAGMSHMSSRTASSIRTSSPMSHSTSTPSSMDNMRHSSHPTLMPHSEHSASSIPNAGGTHFEPLPNNPYAKVDIHGPTVIGLPIPPSLWMQSWNAKT